MKICDRYSHGQVARELMSYNHKKKRQKQAAGAPPSTGLEPRRAHQPPGTLCLFGLCPVLEHRTSADDPRRCTTGPMRLAAQPNLWVLTPANVKSAKNQGRYIITVILLNANSSFFYFFGKSSIKSFNSYEELHLLIWSLAESAIAAADLVLFLCVSSSICVCLSFRCNTRPQTS